MYKPAVWLFAVFLLLNGCRSSDRQVPKTEDHPSSPANVPGAKADGSVLLPNQWSLNPVGRQIVVGDFPVNIAIHPSGRYAAVLQCGYGAHELAVLDLKTEKLVSRVTLEEAFYGLVFSPTGDLLYASGAGTETIHRFQFQEGYLSDRQTIALREAGKRGIPAGLAISRDGSRMWAANLLGQSISILDLDKKAVVGETALADAGLLAAVTDPKTAEDFDEDAITKRARALLEKVNEGAPHPYTCLVDEKRQRLYVSLWAQSAVQVIDLTTQKLLARWPTQEHPNEMVLTRSGRHLFVANANRNTVSVIDTDEGRCVETLIAELEPGSPPGSTPSSLALSSNDSRLFVANANINAVAVFDVEKPGNSRSLGFIPTGWYPTSVRLTPDGKKLLVANGKGLISKANRNGPQPGREAPASVREYIGGLFDGTISVIPLPANDKFEERLKEYTARCYQCRPPQALASGVVREPGHPIPASLGDPTPLRYCIYIVKENRTYDQVLGDMTKGNGDPSLCLFPEAITPNHHKLAREFVLLDNFYVESEVSADGHEWTLGAYATDYVEKMWPMSYGHNAHKKYTYPSEGRFKIAAPAEGYLWDRAKEAGISYRSYGEFVNNGATTNDPCFTMMPALKGHFDPKYRSFDMDYSDQLRADRFISELQRFEREGEMPRLQIVRLPNDHTAGTGRGKLTPRAYLADNDLALGRVVEAISRTRFWTNTAIFVVEDDAQNGPDHVDAHRTIAYAISPYTRRATVDSTMYSTSSMLRTMELILGLRPMSQFDAAAMPMFNSFHAKCDPSPYKTEIPRVNLAETNGPLAWGGDLSQKMNFAREDAADDLLLNQVIWRSVKGAQSPMPPPTRAAFVFQKRDKDD
jgi:DNA-binding beta-propeller fold protein YncE